MNKLGVEQYGVSINNQCEFRMNREDRTNQVVPLVVSHKLALRPLLTYPLGPTR